VVTDVAAGYLTPAVLGFYATTGVVLIGCLTGEEEVSHSSTTGFFSFSTFGFYALACSVLTSLVSSVFASDFVMTALS
jgi:hypothetical protein